MGIQAQNYTHPGIIAIQGNSSLESASTHLLSPLYYLLEQVLPGTIARYEITSLDNETVISLQNRAAETTLLLRIGKIFLCVIGALLLTLPGLLLRTIAQTSETSKILHKHITTAKQMVEKHIATPKTVTWSQTWNGIKRHMENGFLIASNENFQRRLSCSEVLQMVLSLTSVDNGIDEIIEFFTFLTHKKRAAIPINFLQQVLLKLNPEAKKSLVTKIEHLRLGIPLKDFCIDGKHYPTFNAYYLDLCKPAFKIG